MRQMKCAVRNLVATMTVAFALGGCMTSGANDPLPRMSQEDAEAWSRHWIESMARTAGGEIAEDTKKVNFYACLGRNGEVAEDGRFEHSYSARIELPPEDHAQAVLDIREILEEKGFEINGYRSDPSVSPANALDARHPEEGQSVTAQDFTGNENHLLLIVSTPCLLPPDVEQQQF